MMMYLNASAGKGITVAMIDRGKVVAERQVWRSARRPVAPLPLIVDLIHQAPRRRLQAVAVTTRALSVGGATFSQLRSSVACANAVAYARQIPVIGVEPISAQSFARRASVLLSKARVGWLVMPRYQRPPHITIAMH